MKKTTLKGKTKAKKTTVKKSVVKSAKAATKSKNVRKTTPAVSSHEHASCGNAFFFKSITKKVISIFK